MFPEEDIAGVDGRTREQQRTERLKKLAKIKAKLANKDFRLGLQSNKRQRELLLKKTLGHDEMPYVLMNWLLPDTRTY